MVNVVSVKFKGRGKTYYFDPGELEVPEGVRVVVETSKGLELCECVQGNHTVTDERIVPPLRQVVRIATPDDLRIAELCKTREKEAFAICEKKIAEHGLDMKLVDVECNFEGNKMLFFFTSDGRVDFRELVKDLAGIFRTRIELRQIGVRDEAKMLGGLGMCGRPYCCSQFLDDFEPVSTKMAKTQSLSLNPTKISGCCGRLMCCLRYEEEAYEELVKTVPKNGAFVETPEGYGNVAQVNLLRQKVKVKLDDDESFHVYDADEVAAVPGGRPKAGEPLPHVLKLTPKRKEEPEEKEDEWALAPMFAEDTAEQSTGTQGEQQKKSSSRRRSRGKKSGQQKQQSQTGGQEKQTQQQKQSQQPKQEKPQAGQQSGQSAGDGQQKKSSSRRRHHRGAGSGSGQQGQGQTQAQEKTSQQPKQQTQQQKQQTQQQKQSQPKQQGQQQGGQQSGQSAGDGQQKKSSSHHRRYRGKPKAKPAGETKAE